MLFNSFEFLVLFIITFIVYYFEPLKRFQVKILIVSSLIFYSFSQPVLLSLLLSSILINTIISYLIVHNTIYNKKLLAISGVVINLSIIVFFKYSGMLVKSLDFNTNNVGAFLLQLPLPLGISFFTFEGISLVVDTFKGKEIENKGIINVSFIKHFYNTVLFVSFFPHLIAGPILKAHEFYPQIIAKEFRSINWDKAFRQLIVGFFLKMVIADNIKDQTFWIEYPYFLSLSSETLIFMLFGYSIQIFSDFAGYSLIALGLATLLGYDLKANFNHPYISTSFSEFWQRWHISLSSFLKEYLYIPLGGNRRGKMRTYLNLFLTMLLGGLWHGAAWGFAIWGFTHGIFLAAERLFNDNIKLKIKGPMIFIKWLTVFTLVTLAWLLFKLPDFSQATQYLKCILYNWDQFADLKRNSVIIIYSIPIIIYSVIGVMKEYKKAKNIKRYEWAFYGSMLFLLATNSGNSADFIYFQF